MKWYSDNLVRCMCTCYNWTIDVSSATFSFICILSSETLQGPGTWIWEGGVVVRLAGPFIVCTHSHKERWSDIHLCSRDSLWQRNAVTEPSVCCCNAGLGHESKTLRKVQMIIFRVCDMQSNIKRNKKKWQQKGRELKYLQSQHAIHSTTHVPADTSHWLDL